MCVCLTPGCTLTCHITVHGVLVDFGFLWFKDDAELCSGVWPYLTLLNHKYIKTINCSLKKQIM